MNRSQLDKLLAVLTGTRHLTVTAENVRTENGISYVQLTVNTPTRFPELTVKPSGTLDAREVKSFPTAKVMPYYQSLAYSDVYVSMAGRGWAKYLENVRNAPAPVAVSAPTPVIVDPFADVPEPATVEVPTEAIAA